MREEIQAEFNRSGFSIDENAVDKCLTFCVNYKLAPSDLVSSWELHYLNRQLNEPVVHNAEIPLFLLHLQNEQREASLKEEQNLHIYSIQDVEVILSNGNEDNKEDIPGTPTDWSEHQHSKPFDSACRRNQTYSSSAKPSDLVTPFVQRKNKFSIQTTGNDLPNKENIKNELDEENSDDNFIKRVQPSKRCSLLVHGSQPEPGCRYMYEKIEDRVNFLENCINKHSAEFAASKLFEEPTDPTIASQKSRFSVGMICCDGEGRLNDKSILLQSSVEHSGGQRVRLDLQKLSQFSIFPGQVVGIEGNNPSGHCLIASKIVDHVPLSVSNDVNLNPAKKRAMDQEFLSSEMSDNSAELSLIIAAGPFTTNDNLFFEPLSELLAYASRKLPQLLILMGPFVDSEHPEVKRGALDRSFDEIFHVEIISRLQAHVEYIGSAARVILVPSIRDANHDFVFPQPAFDIQTPNLKHQITSIRNPGIFEANEVKVGCCTVDILKHLSGEIVSRKAAAAADGSTLDGLSRLAYHILGQRNFYPLYPPSESIPLDTSVGPLDLSPLPDILILPSDLAHFVKVVSVEEVKCICVNPGRLAKGEKGGSFVQLTYNKNHPHYSSSASIINI